VSTHEPSILWRLLFENVGKNQIRGLIGFLEDSNPERSSLTRKMRGRPLAGSFVMLTTLSDAIQQGWAWPDPTSATKRVSVTAITRPTLSSTASGVNSFFAAQSPAVCSAWRRQSRRQQARARLPRRRAWHRHRDIAVGPAARGRRIMPLRPVPSGQLRKSLTSSARSAREANEFTCHRGFYHGVAVSDTS
jgi:hypothetical protein